MAVPCLCAVSLAVGFGAHSLVSGVRDAAAPAVPHAPVTATTTIPVTTTPPAPAPDRRTISIAAVGDTMLGSPPQLPPSPGTYLAAMRADLRGTPRRSRTWRWMPAPTSSSAPARTFCGGWRSTAAA